MRTLDIVAAVLLLGFGNPWSLAAVEPGSVDALEGRCEELYAQGTNELKAVPEVHRGVDAVSEDGDVSVSPDTAESATAADRLHAHALEAMEAASEACLEGSRLAREPEEAARLAARGYLIRGEVSEERQQWREARVAYEEGIDVVTGLDGDGSAALPELYEQLSDRLLAEGRYDEGRRRLEEALAVRVAAFGPRDPRILPSLYLLAAYYNPRGKSPDEQRAFGSSADKSEDLLRRAVAIAREHGDPSLEREALTALAGFFVGHKRYAEAEAIRLELEPAA